MNWLQIAPLLYQLIAGDQVTDLSVCREAMDLCVTERCESEFSCNECVLDIAETIELNCDLLVTKEQPL